MRYLAPRRSLGSSPWIFEKSKKETREQFSKAEIMGDHDKLSLADE